MKWYEKLWYKITFRKHLIEIYENADKINVPGELVWIKEWW